MTLNFVNWAHILDPKSWPENLAQTFGEKEIRNLAKRLQLNERESIRGFRDYFHQKIFPENSVDLKNTFNAVPISSSECEQGFSQMNLILTSTRASLSTTVLALLFVRVVGTPLRHFSPTKYIESWILRGRHSAVDTNSKESQGRGVRRKHGQSVEFLEIFFCFKFLCFVL
jgi:AraC-like DNA-binding protein